MVCTFVFLYLWMCFKGACFFLIHVGDEEQPAPVRAVLPSDVSQGQATQGQVTQVQVAQVTGPRWQVTMAAMVEVPW